MCAEAKRKEKKQVLLSKKQIYHRLLCYIIWSTEGRKKSLKFFYLAVVYALFVAPLSIYE